MGGGGVGGGGLLGEKGVGVGWGEEGDVIMRRAVGRVC